MAIPDAFWQARLDALAISIPLYEAAIDALATGNVQQYTLDTGQNRQVVTKLDLVGLQKTLDSLLNRFSTIEARLNGSGVRTGFPAW